MRRAWTTVFAVAALGLVGCGSDDDEAQSGGAPVAKQKVEYYETELRPAQARRLFAGQDEAEPGDLAGRWTMDFNETLKLIDLKAPDLGGVSLLILRQEGETLVVRDRDCPGDITLRMKRSSDSLTLTRQGAGCAETAGLLVEQPWQRRQDP